MGSGSSKTKTGSAAKEAKNMVVADVVVPNQSEPVRIQGEVDPTPFAVRKSGDHTGRVTEIGPNKFSMQVGEQSIGTFEASSASDSKDFASYLANAASLTIKNVHMEMVDGDEGHSRGERSNQPLIIQLGGESPQQRSDEDMEWEEIIQDLGQGGEGGARQKGKSRRGIDLLDGPTTAEEAKGRKAQLKEALRSKQAKLPSQEYEQIIANHRQEVELMSLLREKEKERQKFSLASKVAARKKRRKAKQDFSDGKDSQNAFDSQVTSDPGIPAGTGDVNKATAPQQLQDLEMELRGREAAFEREMREKKGSLTDAEYARLVAAHKQELAGLQRRLDRQRDRQQRSLLDKLAARRARRSHADGEQSLIAKLEAQMFAMEDPEAVTENPAMVDALGADELRELQLAISKRDVDFKKNLKEMKASKSETEAAAIVEQHRREMTEMQQQLDLEKARMKTKLMATLEARRKKGGEKIDESEPALSAEEIKQLQMILGEREAHFKMKLRTAKRDMSQPDYQQFLDQHQQDMEALERRLELERLRMEQSRKDKMAARRFRRPPSVASKSAQKKFAEVSDLERQMAEKEAAFAAEAEAKKSRLSHDEYERLLQQHREELAAMRGCLERARERQRRHLQDKLGARRRRRGMLENEEEERSRLLALMNAMTEPPSKEEFEEIADDIIHYDEAVRMSFMEKMDKCSGEEQQKMMLDHTAHVDKLQEMLAQKCSGTNEEIREIKNEIGQKEAVFIASVETKKGDISSDEYERLLRQHQQELQGLEKRLGLARERQVRALKEKIEKRRGRMLMAEGSDEEIKLRKLGIVSRTKSEGKIRIWGSMETGEENSDDEGNDDDDDDDDEVLELHPVDLTDQSQYTSTSLWTTSTQSIELVIIPLKDEYPVKRKRELYTDPIIFREIDAHAIKLAQTVSLVTLPSFSALVNELTAFGTTELQKVRLVFRWLTAQNCEEMDLNDVIDDTPLGVLKGLYRKKITFSTLFMRMCRFIGLQCVEIVGIARVKGYNAGQFISSKEIDFHHTWNAVRIDGYWHFVDCNWGVAHIAGSMTNDPFRFEYDEHFFLADPDVIIYSHLPNDTAWQLLQEPLDLHAFNQQVLLKPDFFKFGFALDSHRTVHVDVPHGDLNIRIQCPSGFILACRLATADNDRDISVNHIPFDLYEFIHQVSDTVMACFLRIPEAGNFYLTFYAKRQYLDGELNIESNTEICKYSVCCHAPSRDPVPLPASPADHWGPIGIANVGLVPITHTTSVAMPEVSGDFEFRFKVLQPLSFKHTLTGIGIDAPQLRPYSAQRNVEDQLVITVTPPRDGRYGLHIHVHYQGLARPVHLCSYLLVVQGMRSQVLPMPLLDNGEAWGPSLHCESYGLAPFTHLDSLVVTHDASTDIIMSMWEACFVKAHMLHCGRDASEYVESRAQQNSMVFVLQLPYPGYYHLQILGQGLSDPSVPYVCLFNYLIRRV